MSTSAATCIRTGSQASRKQEDIPETIATACLRREVGLRTPIDRRKNAEEDQNQAPATPTCAKSRRTTVPSLIRLASEERHRDAHQKREAG